MNANFDFNSEYGYFNSAPTTLTLLLSNKEVGAVTLDLATYINIKSKTERATLGHKKATLVQSYSDEKVLCADPKNVELYKNAFITFKIKCDY
jgi:hypothetical protein